MFQYSDNGPSDNFPPFSYLGLLEEFFPDDNVKKSLNISKNTTVFYAEALSLTTTLSSPPLTAMPRKLQYVTLLSFILCFYVGKNNLARAASFNAGVA